MSSKKYKVLNIGLGKIGLDYDYGLDSQYIMTHSRAFTFHKDFDLIAAVDIDSESRKNFETKFKKKAYSTIQQALRDNVPDIVVIAVPTQYHLTALQEVLNLCHPSLVLCEKPLAYSLDDAKKMMNLCQSSGVKLVINYMRQFQPSTGEVQRRIASGEIQAPIRGTVFYTKGFLHNGSHFINLLSSWLGDIVGFEGVSVNKRLAHNDADIDVTINFEKGKVIFISLDESNYSHYSMVLHAQNGCLRYDDGGNKVSWYSAQKSETIKGYTYLENEGKELDADMNRSQWYVADEIKKMLASGGSQKNLSNVEKSLATLRTIREILTPANLEEAEIT
jgi:predicted dehydrogenase